MSKPVIHIILPPIAADTLEALVVVRSMESFRRQMYPFEVVVHDTDHEYETNRAAVAGQITVEKDLFPRN